MTFRSLLETWLWVHRPAATLRLMSRLAGSQFRVSLVSGRELLLVSQPRDVQAVFKGCPQAGNDELRPFLGPRSLFLLRGEAHRQERRWLQTALNAEFAELRFAEDLGRVLEAHAAWGSRASPFQQFRRAALISMVRLCFGPAARPWPLVHAAEQMFDATTAWTVFSHRGAIRGGRVREALATVRDRVAGAISEARSGRTPPGGVVGRWIADPVLSEESLLDEVCTLISAGSEPPAAALAWAAEILQALPSAAADVDDRLAAASADPQGAADAMLPVAKEVLRFMPVVPVVDRSASGSLSVGPATLEVGDRVAACSLLTHARADVFEEPEAFRPGRFDGREYSPFEFYPFGGGVHRCIGFALALAMISQGIVVFRRSYEIHPSRRRLPPARMHGVVLLPARRRVVRSRAARAGPDPQTRGDPRRPSAGSSRSRVSS